MLFCESLVNVFIMKIFIAGAGAVGTHLAKLFVNSNHAVILMDDDESKLEQFDSNIDLLKESGSMTSIGDLKEAGAGNADLFIAVPPYPDMSILACVLAKKLGAKTTVARVNNSEYLQPTNLELFHSIGVDELIYPEQLGAMEAIESIKRVGIRQMYEFSNGDLVLAVIKLRNNAPLVGKTFIETAPMHVGKYNIVAIYRNGETLIPHGSSKLEHDDLGYFVTTRKNIPQVLTDAGKEQYEIKSIMILGGSRIGQRIAAGLGNSYEVKLIEVNREKSERLANKLENTLVINGDGRNMELMKDEGIQKVNAFIAVTDSSEVNLLACQLAKKMGVKKTVAEVENLDYIPLAEGIGIGTIINKKLIAAGYIYRYTLHAHVAYVKCLTSTNAEMLELVAQPNSKIQKAPLRELSLPKDMNIGGLIRNGEPIIVSGDTKIEPYDKVVVFAMQSSLDKVEKLFN